MDDAVAALDKMLSSFDAIAALEDELEEEEVEEVEEEGVIHPPTHPSIHPSIHPLHSLHFHLSGRHHFLFGRPRVGAMASQWRRNLFISGKPLRCLIDLFLFSLRWRVSISTPLPFSPPPPSALLLPPPASTHTNVLFH